MTTNRARMSSPRLVVIRQRSIDSSQRTVRTWVEKIAPSYRPKCLAMSPAVLVDLGAVGELLRRHEVEFLEQRDVAVRVVVALNSGEAVPVPDAAEVPAHLDDPDVVDAGLLEVRGGQQSSDSTTEDGDLDVLGDRSRGVRPGCAGRPPRTPRTHP